MTGEHLIEVSALHLGGSGARAIIDFAQPLALGENLTLEVWFRPDLVQGSVAVLAAYLEQDVAAGTPVVRPVFLWLDNGKPVFSFAADRSNTQPANLVLGTNWCHLAIVCSKNSMAAMFCQPPQQPSTLTMSPWGQGSFTLKKIELGGFDETGAAMPAFNGAFAELRVWKTAHTNQQLDERRQQQLVGNEAGLAGYWMLDEGSGETLYDSSVNDNDGLNRGGDWERASRLQLKISPADARISYLKDIKLPAVQKAYEQRQQQQKDLVAAIGELEGQKQKEDLKRAAKELEARAKLEQRQQELAERKATIEKEKAETLKKQEATRKIMLSNFIECLQHNMATSRAKVAQEQRNVQGLDNITMEVKMVPGYAGVGLQLPQSGMKIEAGRLSTLTVRLKARRKDVKAEPKFAPVPQLEGATEIFARRKLGEAGFRVDVIYEAAERAEQHGRVLRQIYTEKKPGQAELDSVITLVIGQHG